VSEKPAAGQVSSSRESLHLCKEVAMSRLSHSEVHMVHRIGWLRAAVLGANDGIVSTSSLSLASRQRDPVQLKS
jgi:VIT1/CCC1 family predicted Fe2+/Mn2+ transporter